MVMIAGLLLSAILAGIVGSILGLGGGIVLVPLLTIFFEVPINQAVIISLVSIVATSLGSSTLFLEKQLTNVRVATVLELGTILGAILGVFLVTLLSPKILFIVFGLFLIFSALQQFQQRLEVRALRNDSYAEKLKLQSFNPESGNYFVDKVPAAFAIMVGAGAISALLGIGAGAFKVMAMDRAMKLPLKVSSATSSFMIGVTAAASAIYYYTRDAIPLELTLPVCLGALVGALLGAKLMVKLKLRTIRYLFVVALIIIGLQMLLRGLNYGF